MATTYKPPDTLDHFFPTTAPAAAPACTIVRHRPSPVDFSTLSGESSGPVRTGAAAARLYSAAAEVRPKGRIVWKCRSELDARGRQPPHPLDAIRTALADLPAGEAVSLRTKTRPIDVIEGLQQLGLSASSTMLLDGTWRTVVHCD